MRSFVSVSSVPSFSGEIEFLSYALVRVQDNRAAAAELRTVLIALTYLRPVYGVLTL